MSASEAVAGSVSAGLVSVSASEAVAGSMSVSANEAVAGSVSVRRKILQDDCALNYAPKMSLCLGFDELHDSCAKMMQIMRKDKRDIGELLNLLQSTYANRRAMINGRATCSEVCQKFPGLFTVEGIISDYAEMVQQPYSHRL